MKITHHTASGFLALLASGTRPVGLGLFALAMAVAAQAQVLVNDLMNNTDRATQNLPSEIAWYKGGGTNVTMTPSASGMVFTRADAGTSRLIAGNFVNSTAGHTLSVGDTLRMDYKFSASVVPSGNAFNTDNRLGLFSFANSANRMAADNSSANGPSLVNVGGYAVFFHISDSLAAAPFTLHKVAAVPTTMSSAASFTALSSPTTLVSGTGKVLTSGAVYTLRMELNYASASLMNVTVSYLDSLSNVVASVTASDSSGIVGAFDSFMYRASAHASFGAAQNITGFSVTAIPEPSTYAALAGLAALGLVAYRRRQTRKAA